LAGLWSGGWLWAGLGPMAGEVGLAGQGGPAEDGGEFCCLGSLAFPFVWTGGNTERMPFSSPARGGAGWRLVTIVPGWRPGPRWRDAVEAFGGPVLAAVGAEGGRGDVVLGVVDGGRGSRGGRGQRPGLFDQPGR